MVDLKLAAVFSILLIIQTLHISCEVMSAKKLFSVEYEVYGRVQGVFFRKYTQRESKKLGLRGWCMNTEKGTVQGIMEGDELQINQMKHWLQTTGSPSSKIEKVDFRNQKEISQYGFSNFSVKG